MDFCEIEKFQVLKTATSKDNDKHKKIVDNNSYNFNSILLTTWASQVVFFVFEKFVAPALYFPSIVTTLPVIVFKVIMNIVKLMLWHVMICYVILCYVVLCYVMLWYVMLWHVMLCYVMLCYVMLQYVIQYHVS